MCTLVVAAGLLPDRLVVVANRDERKDRPSSPPLRWDAGFVAPRDEVAGGTWLGVNDHGVFVGITNRFKGPADPARISRGKLVTDALAGTSAREIHARMAALDPRAYNGFHLVYTDGREVLATVSDGASLAQLSLGTGLHIVTERAFGAASDAPRVARIRAAFAAWLPKGDLEGATRLLAEHDAADPLGATCIHLDGLAYGTRSAMVLELPSGRMLWAEGPPCTTPFRQVSVPGKTG